MHDHLRALAVHTAHAHRAYYEGLGPEPEGELLVSLLEGVVYDGLWLTKFPLLFTPTYGVKRLDALNKAWSSSGLEELKVLRALVDADMVRFVLSLSPEVLQTRVEIFFGGRAMNKPLWQYLAAWFEHDAYLRGRWGVRPNMLSTVFG